MKTEQLIGSDLLKVHKNKIKSWGASALLCNHSSMTSSFESAPSLCSQFLGDNLKSMIAPQHGYWGTEQDNMIETKDSYFKNPDLPIYSLYHDKREPDEKMLKNIDTLLIDLQIVGCRVYTFKWTILNCLKAAKRLDKRVVIFDRPNPLGHNVIEGRIWEKEALSFVGMLPIAMRHGLSVGEFARFANNQIGANLEVLPFEGWNPEHLWNQEKKIWPYTSPNLPNFDSVVLYPGMVLFEGTNLSEGRGTTLPFQIVGAPYVKDPDKIIKRVKDYLPKLEGVYLKEAFFNPTFNKWKNETCGGLQILVTDPEKIRSYSLALAILKSVRDYHENQFQWKEPPYEYDYKNNPIHLILGSNKTSLATKEKKPNDDFWLNGLKDYTEQIKSSLLYKRELRF